MTPGPPYVLDGPARVPVAIAILVLTVVVPALVQVTAAAAMRAAAPTSTLPARARLRASVTGLVARAAAVVTALVLVSRTGMPRLQAIALLAAAAGHVVVRIAGELTWTRPHLARRGRVLIRPSRVHVLRAAAVVALGSALTIGAAQSDLIRAEAVIIALAAVVLIGLTEIALQVISRRPAVPRVTAETDRGLRQRVAARLTRVEAAAAVGTAAGVWFVVGGVVPTAIAIVLLVALPLLLFLPVGPWPPGPAAPATTEPWTSRNSEGDS